MLSLLVCLVGTIELSIKREFSTSPKINYILTKTLICCSIYNNIKYYYNHINSTKGDKWSETVSSCTPKKQSIFYFIILLSVLWWNVLVGREKWGLWILSELFCIAKAEREEGVVEWGGCGCGVEEWHCCFFLSASHHVNYRIWLSSGPRYFSLRLSRMQMTWKWKETVICLCFFREGLMCLKQIITTVISK